MIKKHIFVDLDNCLVSCSFRSSANSARKLKGALSNLRKGTKPIKVVQLPPIPDDPFGLIEVYESALRPGALDLLQELRSKFGAENVRMLTLAVRDYALENIRVHGLGFRDDQVFARDVIDTGIVKITDEEVYKMDWKGEVSLIDNLPSCGNAEKISCLTHMLSPEAKSVAYVQVPEYTHYESRWMGNDLAFTEEHIRVITTAIEENISIVL